MGVAEMPEADAQETLAAKICCDAQRGISDHGVVGCNPRIEGSR
jgi:hypothetical protein